MSHIHRYAAECHWQGSTGAGYEAYDRSHTAGATPSSAVLGLSSDPAFRGRSEQLNPEQLLVIAASSCQLLSFLAVSARAGLDVRRYEDHAEAVMPEDDRPVRITSIVLRPHITVATGPSEGEIHRLIEKAHRECYIANSLRTEIKVEADITFV